MMYPEKFGVDPLFPLAADFEIKLKSEEVGLGVVSKRSFAVNEVVAKMTGELIDEIRQHTLQVSSTTHMFDPFFSGYFLHSCAPNISLNMQTMLVTAVRDIKANEYLYMDYSETEDYLFKQFPCSCGAANCRSWITGRLEIPLASRVLPESDMVAEKVSQALR